MCYLVHVFGYLLISQKLIEMPAETGTGDWNEICTKLVVNIQ